MDEPEAHGAGIAWLTAAFGLLLIIAGLAGADGFLARTDYTADEVDRVWGGALSLLDVASGKAVTTFLLGGTLILAALIRNGFRRRPLWAGRLFYVGSTQLLCTAIADFAKPPFGRLRPFQALADGTGSDRWFMGPEYGSFPSGHAAFYAALFLPLAMLFPRWAAALLAIPLLVGAERILSQDHYASDVGASLLLAAIVAGGLLKLLAPGGRHPDARPGSAASQFNGETR
ncbi:MAG TPA: phosphatase PAP2 family protein [Allosphingosinicella sp.]|nr:phosphatase PAP2 family protein [Allosphingosinicella sp.]